jgi:hypothetical protein
MSNPLAWKEQLLADARLPITATFAQLLERYQQEIYNGAAHQRVLAEMLRNYRRNGSAA